MSELALYRKYRPQNFDELIGQDDIVKTLKGAIEKGQVSHAYLFTGARGVGKTSTARIFAKELGTSEKDLFELDAASNRKIDDFRELSESVQSLPFDSKYKIYIIDEVHMLTKEAFNAFLKTLEEPPAHVIFILATTDLDKVPDTIRSRCQVLSFKTADNKAIAEALKRIAKKESLEIGEDALALISFLAEGSFRDAIGIFQKALSASIDNKIDLKDVENTAQIPPLSASIEILEAIGKKDAVSALEIIAELESSNIDFKVFADLLAQSIREVLQLRISPKSEKILREKYTEETFAKLLKLAKEAKSINSKTLVNLIEKMELMLYSRSKASVLELFIYDSLDLD